MKKVIKKSLVTAVAAGLLLQLSACGTILHPERKGQSAGRLDTGIVVLDAIGLLFFLVPGVIAFAVDFNNGTIYLPNSSASTESSDINVIHTEGELTNQKIEQIVLKETGRNIHIDQSDLISSEKSITLSALKSEVKFL